MEFLPAIELNPISQFRELVGQAALFYDSLWANWYLTQGVGLGCGDEAELIDSVGNHILGSSVLTDDDVAALLVGLEHPNHLVWDVWEWESDELMTIKLIIRIGWVDGYSMWRPILLQMPIMQ